MSKGTKRGSQLFGFHNTDARQILQIAGKSPDGTPEATVDVTITSPPYHNLKNYGPPNQIGYGQEFKEYLTDMEEVFSSIFKITKPTGSLWLIADFYSRDREVVPLPFVLAERAGDAGWKLRDVLIWQKDKTRPWTSKGQVRSSFEHILFFSKSEDFKYYLDRIRIPERDKLKNWWVKYPERYNPKGKAPTGNWFFPIPVQGKWRRGYLRHFCPFPVGLVHRILLLCTDEGDVVLDPFAGSGVVLGVADSMNRRYIGLDVHKEYIEQFENFVRDETINEMHEVLAGQETIEERRIDFEQQIIALRQIKYSRILCKELERKKPNCIDSVFVIPQNTPEQKSGKLSTDDVYFVTTSQVDGPSLIRAAKQISTTSALSTFGIAPIFHVTTLRGIKNMDWSEKQLYVYENGVTWRYSQEAPVKTWQGLFPGELGGVGKRNGNCPILTTVRVAIDLKTMNNDRAAAGQQTFA